MNRDIDRWTLVNPTVSTMMVDTRSVERHQIRMKHLGKKKHGVWADTPASNGAVPATSSG